MPKDRTPLDEFAELLKNPSHDLSVDVYNGNKETKGPIVNKHNNERKMTLAKLARQMNARFDILTSDVNSLKRDVKDIKTRLGKVEMRLDYIVEANNLKDNK